MRAFVRTRGSIVASQRSMFARAMVQSRRTFSYNQSTIWKHASTGNVTAAEREISAIFAPKVGQNGVALEENSASLDSLVVAGCMAEAHSLVGDGSSGLAVLRREFFGISAGNAVENGAWNADIDVQQNMINKKKKKKSRRSLDMRSVIDQRVIVAGLRCATLVRDASAAFDLFPELFEAGPFFSQSSSSSSAIFSGADLPSHDGMVRAIASPVGQHVVALLCAVGRQDEAERLVMEAATATTQRNGVSAGPAVVATYEPLLLHLAESGHVQRVTDVLNELSQQRLPVSSRCGAALVRAVCRLGDDSDEAVFEAGKVASNDLRFMGIEGGVDAQNELLAAHARRGDLTAARQLLGRVFVNFQGQSSSSGIGKSSSSNENNGSPSSNVSLRPPSSSFGAPATIVEATADTLTEVLRAHAIASARAALGDEPASSCLQILGDAVTFLTHDAMVHFHVQPTAAHFVAVLQSLQAAQLTCADKHAEIFELRERVARFAEAWGFFPASLERIAFKERAGISAQRGAGSLSSRPQAFHPQPSLQRVPMTPVPAAASTLQRRTGPDSSTLSERATVSRKIVDFGGFAPVDVPSLSATPLTLRLPPQLIVRNVISKLESFRTIHDHQFTGAAYAAHMRICERAVETLASAGELEGAFEIMDEMQENNLSVDSKLFVLILRGLASARNAAAVPVAFSNMERFDVPPNSEIVSAAVKVFLRARDFAAAVALVETEGIPRDLITANSLLQGFASVGDVAAVWKLLNQLGQPPFWEHVMPDVHSYNALVQACTERGDMRAASDAVSVLLEKGISPNSFTFRAQMPLDAERGDVRSVQQGIEASPAGYGDGRNIVFLMRALTRSGEPEEALLIFDRMLSAVRSRPWMKTSGNHLSRKIVASDRVADEFVDVAHVETSNQQFNFPRINALPTVSSFKEALEAATILGDVDRLGRYASAALSYVKKDKVGQKNFALAEMKAWYSVGEVDRATLVWKTLEHRGFGPPTLSWYRGRLWYLANHGGERRADRIREIFQSLIAAGESPDEDAGASLVRAVYLERGTRNLKTLDAQLFEAAKVTNELIATGVPVGPITQNVLLQCRVELGDVHGATAMLQRHYLPRHADGRPTAGLGSASVQVPANVRTFELLLQARLDAVASTLRLVGAESEVFDHAEAAVDLLVRTMGLFGVEANARCLVQGLRLGPLSHAQRASRECQRKLRTLSEQVEDVVVSLGFSLEHLQRLAADAAWVVNLPPKSDQDNAARHLLSLARNTDRKRTSRRH